MTREGVEVVAGAVARVERHFRDGSRGGGSLRDEVRRHTVDSAQWRAATLPILVTVLVSITPELGDRKWTGGGMRNANPATTTRGTLSRAWPRTGLYRRRDTQIPHPPLIRAMLGIWDTLSIGLFAREVLTLPPQHRFSPSPLPQPCAARCGVHQVVQGRGGT